MGDPNTQVHDFEPGIKPSGLFWTMRIGHDAVEVDDDLDQAQMHRRHLPMPDYHDIINAVSSSPKTRPGHVSFDVRWRGDEHARKRIRNATFGFEGEYRPSVAQIRFRVSNDDSDVVYTSSPDSQKTVSGGIGHERNGVFFS